MPTQVNGRVVKHKDGKVEIIFKVDGKLYPHTERNGELMDAYLHTGDDTYLDQLESEITQ
jgi:hypothetical protein